MAELARGRKIIHLITGSRNNVKGDTGKHRLPVGYDPVTLKCCPVPPVITQLPRLPVKPREKSVTVFRVCGHDNPVDDVCPQPGGAKTVHNYTSRTYILNEPVGCGIKSAGYKNAGEFVDDLLATPWIMKKFCKCRAIIGWSKTDQLPHLLTLSFPIDDLKKVPDNTGPHRVTYNIDGS